MTCKLSHHPHNSQQQALPELTDAGILPLRILVASYRILATTGPQQLSSSEAQRLSRSEAQQLRSSEAQRLRSSEAQQIRSSDEWMWEWALVVQASIVTVIA